MRNTRYQTIIFFDADADASLECFINRRSLSLPPPPLSNWVFIIPKTLFLRFRRY